MPRQQSATITTYVHVISSDAAYHPSHDQIHEQVISTSEDVCFAILLKSH